MASKKEQRRDLIKESARQLFIEKNIEQTTFSEIASAAGVGEATVYRHFENKGVLALAIGMDYVSETTGELIALLEDQNGSHLEKLEVILNHYITLFIERPDYMIYLEHFDNFIIHCDEKPDGLEAYEGLFDEVNRVVCDLSAGEAVDDSIRKDVNADLYVYTFNIAFMSLCQKLLLRGRVLERDIRHDHIGELQAMKKVMIDSLRA